MCLIDTIHLQKPPPVNKQLSEIQLARVKEVVLNMPHIMHVLVDGLKAAHMASIIHTNMHPFNIVMDFMLTQQPGFGIIDWKLLLKMPKKRILLNLVFEAEKNLEKVAKEK